MADLEPKRLALLRILEILQKYSDEKHPLKQDEILRYLERDYGIVLERKAVGRIVAVLKDAGYEIESTASGCYLSERAFLDSEIHLLIDGILASKHVNPRHSKELIDKLAALASPSFRKNVKHVYTVNDWDKTEDPALFYTIEIIDEAIERKKQIEYDYVKYGADKKTHVTSRQRGTPYLLILHNQRYYLMSLNEKFKTVFYDRVDHIRNVRMTDEPATSVRTVPGYENGIDYKRFSTALPYMFSDQPEHVEFFAANWVIDQVIDWFGKEISITAVDETRCRVSVRSSPSAMKYWALQYAGAVEITSPANLREEIGKTLSEAAEKYKKQ